MKITRACKCILNFAELYHVSLTRGFGSSKANHVVCRMKRPWIICDLVLATLCKELAPSLGVDWRFDCPTERVPSRFQMRSHLSVCFTCRSTQLSNEDPMIMQLLSIAVNATTSLTSCLEKLSSTGHSKPKSASLLFRKGPGIHQPSIGSSFGVRMIRR
jgi:hypothetical protein